MTSPQTPGYVAPKGRYVPPVLFSPYTGEPRDARDIASDPQGVLIVPHGAELLTAHRAQQAGAGLEADRERFERFIKGTLKIPTERNAQGDYVAPDARTSWHVWQAATAADALRAKVEPRELEEMRQRKDAAYEERNRVVAALASCYPAGIARTAIEGWSDDWHGCVYIDLPTGQASWHFHDSQAHFFAHLPPYAGSWDGHTTDEKYERLALLALQGAKLAEPSGSVALRESDIIKACEAVGMKWCEPDGEEDGFPGAFNMPDMASMQRLFASLGKTVAALCDACFGTGVEGDVDDYGHMIDVKCGSCSGTGSHSIPLPKVDVGLPDGDLRKLKTSWVEWKPDGRLQVYVSIDAAPVAATQPSEGAKLAEPSDVVVALRRLETANNALCAMRTADQYQSMIDTGQGDALIELDDARRDAREALAATQPSGGAKLAEAQAPAYTVSREDFDAKVADLERSKALIAEVYNWTDGSTAGVAHEVRDLIERRTGGWFAFGMNRDAAPIKAKAQKGGA